MDKTILSLMAAPFEVDESILAASREDSTFAEELSVLLKRYGKLPDAPEGGVVYGIGMAGCVVYCDRRPLPNEAGDNG